MSRKLLVLLILSLAAGSLYAQKPKKLPLSENDRIFSPMKYRSIGPFRGGRSTGSTGVIGDPKTYYMGTTGGGVWKTTDIGVSWQNISDGYFTTGSVGAIAVAPSDPNVVFVGMGEHAPRGVMTHHGDGVYKSTDAGKTWKKMGLERSQHISRIIIHPKNPNVVYVAAQGALYSSSKERGLYKSVDGGKTWKNILYVNDKTGASELSMDANNSRILYAAMWEHGRRPWQVISGGPGSGLYKSVDSGETWEPLTKGLPKEMGKMAIAVAPSNSDKVYALIESDTKKDLGGLFVSTNGGENWRKVSGDNRLTQRAWYYIEVFVDPKNENMVYVLSAPNLRSKDGGKTWERLGGTHGDYHDLWINPDNPKNMVISNDGGAAITFNRGRNWTTQSTMPTAQFYRVNTDNLFPYNIYGGQQDNSSVKIASFQAASGGITTDSWSASAGGESAFLAFDPDKPDYVLGGSYQGTINILDVKAKARTKIMAAPLQYLGVSAKDMRYRFNWNAPIIWSKHEPNTYYHAAQFLLKTQDMGKTWTEVSPDLTKNEKSKQGTPGVPYTNEAVGAENYGTISYVSESPHEKGVIWVGTDDGLVQLTRDNGATWKNVTPNGLPETLVNAIDVSPHDKGTAYIATTRYKFNDHRPGLYKTTNYGASWTRIDRGIPANAFTRVVREDDVRKGLLYAGTELGVFISWNDGGSWEPLQLNLPITPITDMKVHKGNLVVATSGRSFWILDDLNVLRQYRGKPSGVVMYQPKDAHLSNHFSQLNGNSDSFDGTSTFSGVNPANGTVFYYNLPKLKESDEVTLEIRDDSGKLIRTISSKGVKGFSGWDGGPPSKPTLSKKEGMNRFVWDMRHPTMPGVPGVYIEASYRGHKAPPGKYTFTLNAAGKSVSSSASILRNPMYPTTPAEYAEFDRVMSMMETEVTTMHNWINSFHEKQKQLEAVLKALPKDAKYDAARTQGEALLKKMKAWDEDMVNRKIQAYDDVENFQNKFSANYMFMMNQTESDIPRVNQPSLDLMRKMNGEWATLKSRADEIRNRDIPAINKTLFDAGKGAIWKE
ncbi:MAG: glycosyl hydrolase [Pyrinomonadaceae bacterium]|nr:glycosyl hydrolase [Pyrinomonadaceae bacterium]